MLQVVLAQRIAQFLRRREYPLGLFELLDSRARPQVRLRGGVDQSEKEDKTGRARGGAGQGGGVQLELELLYYTWK